jgi:hypothetical protein
MSSLGISHEVYNSSRQEARANAEEEDEIKMISHLRKCPITYLKTSIII